MPASPRIRGTFRPARYFQTEARDLQTNEMTGTANQIEWATGIRTQVSAEFDRVAAALRSRAGARIDTEAVIEILESKRDEVMANDRAGYFIEVWQELRDQVRQLIVQDPRYQAIKAGRVRER
jgi:hypothetical protein